MINVALCISGEPRSSMLCYPYIAESFILLDPQVFNVDVYVHSRKNFRALFLYDPKYYKLDSNNSKNSIGDYTLSPELMDDEKFYSHFSQNSSFLENQLLMLDGIVKCFTSTNPNQQKYDLYMRCRPDFITDSKINIESIAKDILYDRKYDMVIPSKGIMKTKEANEHVSKEYNDQFAIGNYRSMVSYCNVSKNLSYLIDQTKEFKLERWLKKQLDDDGINVSTPYLPLALVRGTRIYSNRGFDNFDISFYDE
jgi:hypothetical protein